MLILSNIKTVQGWIQAYKNKCLSGLNYAKSWIGQHQLPEFIHALESFCEERKNASAFSELDLVALSKIIIHWSTNEPHSFDIISPIPDTELTVLKLLQEEHLLDDTFFKNGTWEVGHKNPLENKARYTVYYMFLSNTLLKIGKPLLPECVKLTLILARRLLMSDPQSKEHLNILKTQSVRLPPLPRQWPACIATHDDPLLLMQAYQQICFYEFFSDESIQMALTNHRMPDVLAKTAVNAAQQGWDAKRIQVLFKSQNPRQMFEIITSQGDDRRLLPHLYTSNSPLALSAFYNHVKALGFDEATLVELVWTAKNYPSSLEYKIDDYLALPLLKTKVAINFLIQNKFDYSALRLLEELRPEDQFLLDANINDVSDFLCAYQTAKIDNFLSKPMLESMLKVQNPQQFVHNLKCAQELDLLGSELLPLFVEELPETEQHLQRLKQIKEQGKLNVTAFNEFMHEIMQNAKQAKPKEGVSVTELSLFSHTTRPELKVVLVPQPEQPDSAPEAKQPARPRRSVKR